MRCRGSSSPSGTQRQQLIIKRLLRFGLGGVVSGILLVGLSLLAVAASLLQPVLLSRTISVIQDSGSPVQHIVWLGALLLIAVVCSALRDMTLYKRGERLLFELRTDYSRKVTSIELLALQRRDFTEIAARFTNDLEAVKNSYAMLHRFVLSGFPLIVGSLVGMSLIDVQLLVVALAVISVATISVALLGGKIQQSSLQHNQALASAAAALANSLKAIRTLRVFGAVETELSRIKTKLVSARSAGERTVRYLAIIEPVSTATIQLCFIVIIGVGFIRSLYDETPSPGLAAFLVFLFILVAPINQLFALIAELRQAEAAWKRLDEFDSEPQERADLRDLPRFSITSANSKTARPDGIEFKQVTFSYPSQNESASAADNDPPALSGLTFSVPKGSSIALMGDSGSGKTTALNLLALLYEVSKGSIEVFGTPLSTVHPSQYRESIALVDQEASILSASVRENLVMGGPPLADELLFSMMDLVGLHARFSRSSASLDLKVGEGGAQQLSGGENQRLCLARALLRKPSLLLLDEPTSQLDSWNEKVVLDAIANITWDCTVVFVTHRATTARHADSIMLIKAGSSIAQGSHASLLDTSPEYRQIVSSESAN